MQDESTLEHQFRALVDEHQASLIRLCRGYDADEAQRQELLQEIFLQIWRSLPSFRGDASLRTWVFRVAHNVAATHVLKSRRRPTAVEPPADAEPVETTLERRDRLEQLQRAIQSLPVAERQIVLLHLEEIPQSEIAEICGLSVSNISTRLHRAKKQLKQAMESNDG